MLVYSLAAIGGHSPTGLPKSLSLMRPLVSGTPRPPLPANESDYEAVRLQHALFWKRATRESGPIVLIEDIVKTRVDVNAKMFVPGDSCYGEQFGCVLLK